MRPGSCALCVAEGTYVDEVSGTRFCAVHAGPLAWDGHDVDCYSLALRLAGLHDQPLPLPNVKPDKSVRREGSAA